ncbi:MAG: DUF3307 domain-containing protein [Calothrix sp. SM1_5_4]|nr:DUF3307 domain-containing protein [Calothrix sp. SM1_5_4]
MTINVELLLWLLIIFQLKHWLADFVFQNVYMLQKARPGWDFVLPLAIHSGVHAAATLAIALYLNPTLWWLAVVDFVIHFVMDRIKAGPRYLGRFDDMRSKMFWMTFGLDQMVHHLTHLYIAWQLASH